MFGKRLTLIYWLVVVHIICSPIGLAQLDEDTIVGIWLFDEGKGERQKIFPEMAITPNWLVQNGQMMVNVEKVLNLMVPTTSKSPLPKVQMTISMGLPTAFG